MLDQRLLVLIGSLSEPGHRPRATKKLAEALGADDLIIFSRDPLLNILLPAPGFPQTLPQGKSWREFIAECLVNRHHAATLISPYTNYAVPVTGVSATDGSVIALIGGSPDLAQLVEVAGLVPLLVAALFNERVAIIAKGEIEAETLAAEKSRALAEALDATRRELEAALRKSTNILESITDAFVAVDRDWRFTEVNPQAELLLKKSRNALIGKNIWDEFPEEAYGSLRRASQEAAHHQKVTTFEEYFPFLAKWHEVRIYPARDGLAIYFADINERKRSAEQLRHSQEWFRTTLKSIGDGVIAVNVDRTITFLNPVAEALTGWTLSEAAGRPMSEVFNIIHEKTRKPAANPVDTALREKRTVGLANHTALLHRDGKEYVIEDSASPIVDENGVITGVVLVFRDVTESYAQRVNLKSAIEDRDRSLETLVTINEVGQRLTAELDLEKLVQEVTDAATRLSGAQFGAFFYKMTNEQGEAYLLYTISGVPKEAFAKFPQPRPTQIFHPTFMGEGTVRSDDITQDPRYGKNDPHKGMPVGHLPVKSYLAVSVVSRSGEVLGGLFFGHEKPGVFTASAETIVEGLAAQAAIAMDNARLYKSVKESVQAREEFLSIASHELKTPLTSLKLQVQMRARNLQKSGLSVFTEDRLRKMIDADSRQIERLSRLIDDMLDISRIGAGKLAIQPETFDLCALTKDVLDRYLPQFQQTGSSVHLICCDPVEGFWDRFRIEQVIINLLTNAARYGAGKPVEVSVKQVGAKAILIVKDQGIGIAKENQNRVFERFERAISATQISGLGLGLYIVRQILEMHHGLIRVESEIGKGSTFIVELPLSQLG